MILHEEMTPQPQETQDPFLDGMDRENTDCPADADSLPEEPPVEAPADQTPPAAADLPPAGRREEDLDAFARLFPEAARDPDSIPQAVWDAVRQGASLSLAYALHQLSQSRQGWQSQQNAARSTGSMSSSGADRRNTDPFLEGWNN